MKTNILLAIGLNLALSGCSSFWETYGKRSDLTIGYSANNVGEPGRGERNLQVNGTLRGSNNSIEKVFRSLVEFSNKQLGLK